MTKQFDCVKMMRDIRNRLSERYKDPAVEEKELNLIRKKYGLS